MSVKLSTIGAFLALAAIVWYLAASGLFINDNQK